MDETEKRSQTNPEGTGGEVESLDARRAYVPPEVMVLELRSVIKSAASGDIPDFGHHLTYR